jgi:acyl-CoA thioesterase
MTRSATTAAALGLADNGAQWALPVTARLCAGDGRIFGGVLTAAAAAVATLVTSKRALAVLSIDFLAAARVGDELVLAPRSHSSGRSVTTSEIVVTAAERVVAVASCAMVSPSGTAAPVESSRSVHAHAPSEVPAPTDCPLRLYRWPDPASISSWLEVRIAADEFAEGRGLLWVRLDGVERQDGSLLALAADHVAFVGGTMLGANFVLRTMQQSIRFRAARHEATEWVLVEVAVDALDDRVAHGGTRLWTQDGRLLALSEQTLLVTARE